MDNALILEPGQFVNLMWGFAATVSFVWLVFWVVIWLTKTDPIAVINSTVFLSVVTVGFALSAIVILCLARVLTGQLAGTMITGMIAYVLGKGRSNTNPEKSAKSAKSKTPETANSGSGPAAP